MGHWENLLVELAFILRRTELLTNSLSDGVMCLPFLSYVGSKLLAIA